MDAKRGRKPETFLEGEVGGQASLYLKMPRKEKEFIENFLNGYRQKYPMADWTMARFMRYATVKLIQEMMAEEGDFSFVPSDIIQVKSEDEIEAEELADALFALLQDTGGKWEGTASELLDLFPGYSDEKVLGKKLEALSSLLKEKGIKAEKKRTRKGRIVYLSLMEGENTQENDNKKSVCDAE